jgi:hypothetical protein
MRDVREIIASAQDSMAKAADAEGTDATTFNGHQAIVILLGAILLELNAIRKQLESKA